MYKGTYEGDIAEIRFVTLFNSNKKNFINYLSNFPKYEYKHLWMVRVTTKQISKLSSKKVFTRSDCYLVEIITNIDTILKENNYYLSEELLEKQNIIHNKISYSGVSIKMTSSKNFQILKLTPNSFKELFHSYELGAGASLFCQKENELNKNPLLINGWNTTIQNMTKYFDIHTHGNDKFYLDKEICKNIKNYSCDKIKKLIENSIELQQKIFNGIGLYNEPYTAFYFYQGYNISNLTTIPFYITTGSGRSSGNYTIVLKPIL